MKNGNVRYYNMSNKSPDTTGELVRNMTIGRYFDGCPLGKNVFWEYIASFCSKYKIYLNIRRLKEKYSDEKWILES